LITTATTAESDPPATTGTAVAATVVPTAPRTTVPRGAAQRPRDHLRRVRPHRLSSETGARWRRAVAGGVLFAKAFFLLWFLTRKFSGMLLLGFGDVRLAAILG
jgi:hypothetical protein